MEDKTISIKELMDELYLHPMLQSIPLETVVHHVVNFMRILGCPSIFTQKVDILDICKYRASLPCDYVSMISVRDAENIGMAYRYTTDVFHISEHEKPLVDLTYKIQGGVIYTSTEKGKIEIVYNAIAVDSEGFPLLPDNPTFLRALKDYVKVNYFTILFDLGKIDANVLNQAKQDYAWSVGSAESESNRMSLDKAESFFNQWSTLLLRHTQHNSGFIRNGNKEYFKR